MPLYILTGTPGAGKTAILRLLELDGYAVVEEAATDVIAVDQALGHDKPLDVPAFIDKIVLLQRHRQTGSPAGNGATVFDRSPVCTLALSRYFDVAPSRLLLEEIDRILAQRVYEPTVFFVRNQGFVHPTPTRRISYANALQFERIHENAYAGLGFQLIEVPAATLTNRVALVKQTIEQL